MQADGTTQHNFVNVSPLPDQIPNRIWILETIRFSFDNPKNGSWKLPSSWLVAKGLVIIRSVEVAPVGAAAAFPAERPQKSDSTSSATGRPNPTASQSPDSR
jgi:cytoskeletal protein RodZ